MRVSLFVTCLVDQLWPEVGQATVAVLERAGCEVDFDARQTCCSQPAYNTGFHDEAREVARGFLALYDNDGVEAVVMPSGSCCAMAHHTAELFADDAELRASAERVAAKSFELSTFLVRKLGVDDLGARFDGKVTWHDACHGLRDLGIKNEPRTLINKVAGATLVEMDAADSCCGFRRYVLGEAPRHLGRHSSIVSWSSWPASGVDALVSGDVSCLMQIGGRLQRQNLPVRTMHLAELLASGSAQ